MNRNLLFYFTFILFCFSQKSFAQTYQLSGNPVNTTGWDVVPSASVNTDFIQLTANLTSQVGGIKLNSPINLKFCDKWRTLPKFLAHLYCIGPTLFATIRSC